MGIKDRLPTRRAQASDTDPASPGSLSESPATPAQGPRDWSAWRSRLAALLWTVCVVLALVLAIGALLVAIEADEDNGLVSFVLSAADGVDLGIFSREDGLREFTGADAETRSALFNWGLGAVVYLVLGRVLERLVRPRR